MLDKKENYNIIQIMSFLPDPLTLLSLNLSSTVAGLHMHPRRSFLSNVIFSPLLPSHYKI